ncbi:MAG: glycosyltransferase [Phycisphaerae bacterium]
MDFLLVTLGSFGDVHPFVGLGQVLAARGHRVRLLVNEHFHPLVRGAGLEAVSSGTAAEYARWAGHPDIWHPRKGTEVIFKGVAQTLRQLFDAVDDAAGPGTIPVASTISAGARIWAEVHDRPFATVHLAPMCLRTVHDMPALPGMPFSFNWMPMWMRKKFWEGADRFFIDPLLAKPVNELRAQFGLEAVDRLFSAWWQSPHLVLGLWPEWYGPVQPDWPEPVTLCGFPMYDEADVTPMSPELLAFLDAGEPPVAFTPGSANVIGHRFFAAAADACRRLGRRGLLLTRHPEQLPAALPPGVIHVPYAPFSRLLPRTAALVHHGGVGTMSQALAAGVPQLIMPMAHDQADNAVRLKRLGCAESLGPRRFRGRALAGKLATLLNNPAYVAAARKAAKLVSRDGLRRAAEALEALEPEAVPQSA